MQYRIESNQRICNTTERYSPATSFEIEKAERIQELEDKLGNVTDERDELLFNRDCKDYGSNSSLVGGESHTNVSFED